MSLPALDVRSLMHRHGLRPDKRLGQNFLVDPAGLQAVVRAAGLEPADAALEVGAGLGSLTRLLAITVQKVVAVELDQRLIPVLREVLNPHPNVEVVHGDILKLDPSQLMGESSYQVVANIPYYITSALIRHLLEAKHPPRRVTLTVQQEVAERICAQPGEMSLLALGVQVYGQPEIKANIPAGAFYPAPQVNSAVVRVDLFPEPLFPPEIQEALFRLAKAGFSQKRKTMRNSLAAGLHWKPAQAEDFLRQAGIDPQRRAETLSVEEWGRLAYRLLTPQG